MSADELSPADLANFDQAWAETSSALDDLIDSHIDQLAGYRYELCVAGLTHFLRENGDLTGVAQLLAVAVHRLSKEEVHA